MKKVLRTILCIVLCFMLSFSAFAAGGETVLSTTVPTTHEITIAYNDGGFILYQDEIVANGTTLTVDRFDDVLLAVICKLDSHLHSVMVNGVDVTEDILYGRLLLESVHTDLNVVFTFDRCDGTHSTPDDPTVDPDDPTVDPNPDEPEEDPCTHISMSGCIYRNDSPYPNAQLVIDFGEIDTDADDGGRYTVDEIKDGYHTVTILDADGNPVGKANFVVEVTENGVEVTVETLDDGTQIVVVPVGTDSFLLDFIVNAEDGTITLVPGTPEPEEVVPGNPIMDNPIISQTDALIRENPLETALILLSFSFFLLLFVLWRRRREEDEEEPVQQA